MERVNKFKLHILDILIYTIVSIKYLFSLNEYNKELIGKGYLAVLLYEEGRTWKYFFLAILLIALGCFSLYIMIKYRYIADDKVDWIILISIVLWIIIICIAIIYFINNPILRAVFVAVLAGTAYISSQS